MAKRVEEAAEEAPPATLISEAAFKSLMTKIKAGEGKLNEAKGDLGSAIDKAIATHNVHKDALRVTRKYMKKGAPAQIEFIRQLDHMWTLARLGEPEDDMVENLPKRKSTKSKNKGGDLRELGTPTHTIADGELKPIDYSQDAA